MMLIAGRAYAGPKSFDADGGVYLRPWQLPFTPESGLRGLIEPEARPPIQTCVIRVSETHRVPSQCSFKLF